VPRCCRLLLAGRLFAGTLVLSPILLGGNAYGQERGSTIDPDAGLLAPTLDGNPQPRPRFRPRRSDNEDEGAPSFMRPGPRATPASGAGLTGFKSNGGLRPGAEPKTGTVPTALVTPSAPAKSTAKRKVRAKRKPTILDPKAPGAVPARADPTPLAPDRAGALEPLAPKLLQPAAGPIPARFRQFRPGAPPVDPDAEIITVASVPPVWRPVTDPKPFDPLGVQVGAFLFQPGIEYSRGYDTNPARLGLQPLSGSWFDLYAADLLVASNWGRHELTAALRGSYMSFDTSHQNDRPNIDGKVNGRIDVTSLTRLILEGRFILATDYPGSPNIQAGLAHFPIYTTVGASAGIGQRFNRFDVTFKAGFDRTEYQPSVFVDGERVSNADRNYDQYSTTLRTTYDLSPQLRPFAEISGNERLHPVPLDRFGLDRDSVGYSAKAGAAVDFTRTLTGELAAGYLNQMYRDPLPNVGGFSVDGALVWSATALTTAKILASTVTVESPLFLVSGVLTRQVGFQVDHAFRRWLIGTARIGYARDIYAGNVRRDNRYVAGTSLSYLLTRELWLKGEFRQEWQRSNIPGSNYVASIWMLGLRLQR